MVKFFQRLSLWILLVPFALTGTGCAVFRKVTLNYSEAKLPDSQIVIPQQGHKTIVLSLSQPQRIPTATMLVFMKSLSCS